MCWLLKVSEIFFNKCTSDHLTVCRPDLHQVGAGLQVVGSDHQLPAICRIIRGTFDCAPGQTGEHYQTAGTGIAGC